MALHRVTFLKFYFLCNAYSATSTIVTSFGSSQGQGVTQLIQVHLLNSCLSVLSVSLILLAAISD